MKEPWKSTGMWLALVASIFTLWQGVMPLIPFPSPLFEALSYVVLVGVSVVVAWNLCVSVCREVPAVYQRLYRRTKRGRFIALQIQVRSMMIDLPHRDDLWVQFRTADQQRLLALLVELDKLGIAPPIKVPQGHARSDESRLGRVHTKHAAVCTCSGSMLWPPQDVSWGMGRSGSRIDIINEFNKL